MEGKVKLAVQILFLVALAWALAAMGGWAQGFQVNVGKQKKSNRRAMRRHRSDPNPWVASGMVSELIDTSSTDVPQICIPRY